MALLQKLANDFFMPVPQKSGHTYDGTGLANSGIVMQDGQTWSLTFTKPGTYHYICLVHGPVMQGVVIVHAPQPRGHMYIVQAGDGPSAINDKSNNTTNDSFYPRRLTIHVGDTVEWIGGFHTVTFGPDATRLQLEKNIFVPVPQKSGPPSLAFNPKVAFPSGGSIYHGSGFVNSGVLALNTPPGSKAPPSFKLTFTAPGIFEYDCLIHPGMDGTITVAP